MGEYLRSMVLWNLLQDSYIQHKYLDNFIHQFLSWEANNCLVRKDIVQLITMFTSAHSWSLSWVRHSQSSPYVLNS
jgi:hypothetical protein